MSTVLVVEDERQLARLAEINLTAEGYDVIVFNEGKDAWTFLQDHRPDLVILDLMLPTISGWQLLEYIRHEARLAQMPVLVLSALARADEKRRALASGATEYLVKPCSLQRLVESVKQLTTSPHET